MLFNSVKILLLNIIVTNCLIYFHCYFLYHHPSINMPPVEEDKDEFQESKIPIPKQHWTPVDDEYKIHDQ